MAKKDKKNIEAVEGTNLVEEKVEDSKVETKAAADTKATNKDAKDDKNSKKDAKKSKKNKDKKSIGQKSKELYSELKKVSWPTFGKVVKNTCVVLLVVTVCTLLLFGADRLFFWLFGLLMG